MTRTNLGRFILAVSLFTFLSTCQKYPFESREAKRSFGKQINELVTTVTPTDILFVIDNSGSMIDEINELNTSINLFFEELTKSANDYRVGIITPDLEKNIPEVQSDCEDLEKNNNYSTCDGGRLRSSDPENRIFDRPNAEDISTWLDKVRTTIGVTLGCNGSGYEATLEAARRAIVCSLSEAERQTVGVTCPHEEVAQLNAGFIRNHADLVIIFITDEDDCSIVDESKYQNPLKNDINDKFCSPNECYAYLGENNENLDLLQYFKCSGVLRTTQVPNLTGIDVFLNDIIAVKGNVGRVRAGAILGSVNNDEALLGYSSSACTIKQDLPSNACACWSTSESKLFCDITGGVGSTAYPPVPDFPKCGGGMYDSRSGCQALAGGRIVSFLEELANRRTTANFESQTIINSICERKYDQTLVDIVNTVVMTNCFELGEPLTNPDNLQIVINKVDGRKIKLKRVNQGSHIAGWSWVEGTSTICLEGEGLEREIGDKFKIFLLDDN